MSWRAKVDLQHAVASLALVAASPEARDPDERLTVHAERRVRGLSVVEGLSATNNWTDFFEPIRRRWLWSRRWRPLQSVEDAAAHVEWFLQRRPDLGSAAP